MIKLFFAKKGFTLTEIVIAMVILAAAVAGLWASFIASKRYSVGSRTHLMAVNNARYILDRLRYYVQPSTWDTTFQLGGPHPVLLPDGPLKSSPYDGTASYNVYEVPGYDCRQVTLTITWQEPE